MSHIIKPRHHIEVNHQHIRDYQDFRAETFGPAPVDSFSHWFERTQDAIPVLEIVDSASCHRADHRYQRWLRRRYRQPRTDGDLLLIP